MQQNSTHLVLGASGQIGSVLTTELRKKYGSSAVIASDIKAPKKESSQMGLFVQIDATSYDALLNVVKSYNVSTVYLMAAMLSATAENHPSKAWDLNMSSLFNVLNLAKDGFIKHVFWPSSIAVFGPSSPKINVPQLTIMEPTTVYGISKLSGERWCAYYNKKYGIDVRSLRFPGLIGWQSSPGGGTTDYAVDIFHKAVAHQPFECFLAKNTALPMMYMDDAIRAVIELMESDSKKIKVRSSYNLGALSFTPKTLYQSLLPLFPNFEINYAPDFRQEIAESWPQSIDDSSARNDWGWQPQFDLKLMVEDMCSNLRNK
ncbi:MAG: NAD-dependent epimerase/dehydratase family protein [Bacteroidetes bacterium]|nr:NAD-dependent epimerase/dehydratase family protein [Bacteroidota bacterium]MDA1175853.1 NAD-dependent epimerase/dehydratase family protein [Bacteroidota bacterium]